MSGRFCRSRSPPQPKTTIKRRGENSRKVFKHIEQRIGRMRIIDEDLKLPFRRDRFKRPGTCGDLPRLKIASRKLTPSAFAAASAASEFATLNRPISGTRTR